MTPEYLAGIAEPLQRIYSQLQGDIEADIARRIRKAGYVTDTAAWQAERLRLLVGSQEYINQRIAATLGITQKETATLFRAAGLTVSTRDEALRREALAAGLLSPGVPFTASPAFRQVLDAGLKRTMGTMQRLTGSMAKDATGKLHKYLDQAQLMVQSGAFTVQQATDAAVKKFVGEGITTADYASGVQTSIEAAVRRAIITGVNQATAEISLANADAMGTDLVEVTSHFDARPEHATWQGQVYCIHGSRGRYRNLEEATGYGTGAGLCGWNCRHSFYAFVEGLSEKTPKQAYSQEKYEAEQVQRAMERKVREWKRRANTLRAGGVDATKAEEKVAYWQGRLRDHTKAYDLARMYDREKVYGTGTIPRKPRAPLGPPKPAPEELALAKRERIKAESRERTRRWREAKREEAAKAAAAAAEAARAAEEAAAEAARIAAEEAAAAAATLSKADAIKAASRERTRRWREAKKAGATPPATPAPTPAPVRAPAPAADPRRLSDEYTALEWYQTEAYTAVNEFLRTGRYDPSWEADYDLTGKADLLQKIELMRSGIARAEHTTAAKYYRGVGTDVFKGYKKGDTWSDGAFMSTTSDIRTAEDYVRDKGWLISVKAPPGEGVGRLLTGGDAPEFIFSDMSQFKIVDLDKSTRRATIEWKGLRPAEPLVDTSPIAAYSPRVGQAGTYKVYRSTTKSIPPDGVTAFHGAVSGAASPGDYEKVLEYYVDVKNPITIEARNRIEAREKAFKALVGKDPEGYHGDRGMAVAEALRAKGYDAIVYKLPDDVFELNPLTLDMSRPTESTLAKEAAIKAAKEKAAKEAAERAAREAKERAAREAAEAKAREKAEKEAAKRAKAAGTKRTAALAGQRDAIKRDPPTLKTFDAHKAKMLNDRMRGVDFEELEDARGFVEAAAEKAVLRSRISQDTMNLVLKDGKLKTQIELKAEGSKATSGGWLNPEGRQKASRDLFGTDLRTTAATDYEYYGYLWDDDFTSDFDWNGPSQYGHCTLQFKAEARARTTFTCGDSLGANYVPSYIDEVTPNWSLQYSNASGRLASAMRRGDKPTMGAVESLSQAGYVEAQYHGGMTLDDVESFVVGPGEYARRGLDKNLAKALNKRGIRVGVVERVPGTGNKLRWLTEEDMK